MSNRLIGNCIHGNRYHCWHLKKDMFKTQLLECCLCHKVKRVYKPEFTAKHNKPFFLPPLTNE
jgi:hypothetical protein